MNRFFIRIVSFSVLLFFSAAHSVTAEGSSNRIQIVTLESQHKFTADQDSGLAADEQDLEEVISLVSTEQFKKKPESSAGSRGVSLSGPRNLTCRSAYILDAKTGKTVYGHKSDVPAQPASTIKVVTGLIAIESLRDKEMVKTSSYAANMPRSKIYLKRGASYKATDLINAVLLASANDASVALAEKIAGSEQAFARLMTKKAQAMGAKNTICKSANGLTRPGQQSTSRDLARIFNRAMQNQEFADRMAMTAVKTSDGKTIRTHNKALWTVDGAVGGKTGYTDVARKTYVGKFQRGSDELVVAIMGSERMWSDIAALVEYGFDLKRNGGGVRVSEDDSEETAQAPLSTFGSLDSGVSGYTVLADQKKRAKL